MQYKVPQHIDEEDKILGPLTFIDFIYLLVGGALILFCFVLFDFGLFLFLAIPIALLSAALALIKVQDQPFSRFLVTFLLYLRQPKRRVWADLEAEEDETASQLLDIVADREVKFARKAGNTASAATAPPSPTVIKTDASPIVYPTKPARRVQVTLAS